MLILARKQRESVLISDSIEISVLAIRGNSVKLGIKCDRNIPVHRHEVLGDLIHACRTAADSDAGRSQRSYAKQA